jgi:hypothetical protein
MTTYAKSTVELMRQYVDEHPDQEQFTADEIIAWFNARWPKIKTNTVQAHLIQMSTNVRSRVNWPVKPKHNLFFRLGSGLFRRYRPDSDPPPIYPGSPPIVNSIAVTDEEMIYNEVAASEQSEIFAYESHLRDYLAHNLGVLESGMRLYEDEDIPGIEYPIRSGRIDLLAVALDGSLVIIELKVSKGYDRTIGQILRYMGWVRQDLADGKHVRGMIVAHTLSDELVTAAQEANADIRLFEYDISFHVHPKT